MHETAHAPRDPGLPAERPPRHTLETLAADGPLVWGGPRPARPTARRCSRTPPTCPPRSSTRFGQLRAHGRLSERWAAQGARDRSRGDVMAEPPVRPRPGRRPAATCSSGQGHQKRVRRRGDVVPRGGRERARGRRNHRFRASTVTFDGSVGTGESLPGSADLLAAALAACNLKNLERFSGLLPFRSRHARVHVELERREPPPADRPRDRRSPPRNSHRIQRRRRAGRSVDDTTPDPSRQGSVRPAER